MYIYIYILVSSHRHTDHNEHTRVLAVRYTCYKLVQLWNNGPINKHILCNLYLKTFFLQNICICIRIRVDVILNIRICVCQNFCICIYIRIRGNLTDVFRISDEGRSVDIQTELQILLGHLINKKL